MPPNDFIIFNGQYTLYVIIKMDAIIVKEYLIEFLFQL